MKLKLIFVVAFLSLSFKLFAFDSTLFNTWIKVKPFKVEKVDGHSSRKFITQYMISFNLKDGTEFLALAEVSIFDEIFTTEENKYLVFYQSANPAIVFTFFGLLIHLYGIYILVFLGITFSLIPILRTFTKRKGYIHSEKDRLNS